MIDDKPAARLRFALHDYARLYAAFRSAGCEADQAERVTGRVIVARHGDIERRVYRSVGRARGPEDDPWGVDS